MMSRFFLAFLFCLLFLPFSVFAKPPAFSDFAVNEIYKGKNHPIQKKEDFPFSSLEQVLKNGEVNFAGHYIIYMDGCGTGGCVMYSIADAKTGEKVASIPMVYMGDIQEPYMPNTIYKVNSRLIHISGVDAEQPDQYHDDYYVLEKNKLKKITGTVKTIKIKEK